MPATERRAITLAPDRNGETAMEVTTAAVALLVKLEMEGME